MMNLVKIGLKLIKCILIFYELGIFHSDIKPENISFRRISIEDAFDVVFIDLGLASCKYDIFKGFTKQYILNSTTRKDEKTLN